MDRIHRVSLTPFAKVMISSSRRQVRALTLGCGGGLWWWVSLQDEMSHET